MSGSFVIVCSFVKNTETDNAIMAGIFARLKIRDPTAVSSTPLAREVHPVTVPISFNALPEYVDRVWDTMEATETRPFGKTFIKNYQK